MRAGARAGDAAAARSPRVPAGAPAPEFARAVERLTRGIDDPVVKLRAVRESLERYGAVDRAVTALPSSHARALLYRSVRLEGLRRVVGAAGFASASTRLRRTARVGAAGAALAGVAFLGSPFVRGRASPPGPVAAAPASEPRAPAGPSASKGAAGKAPRPADAGAAAAVPAWSQPSSRSALPALPASTWLVERDRDWELYSNGLRIETRFAAAGPPRRFQAFDLDGRLQEAVLDRPVGLLFHTSESDIWPMEAAYNESLRGSSHRLLLYVRRERLYNYLIDRFGRVYRVVDETRRANHAGHSVWAAGGRVYLNLNNAFLGVCFESRWDGGHALPITAAQLQAGHLLTDYLRQRWRLAADMCVTHGLTSVNPHEHLIGHHVDWARGFPFEAFGLPDQYRLPTPAVALFGFGYDDGFLKKVDAPWDGVRAAEHLLEAEARGRGLSVEELRRERRGLYDRWMTEQARGEGAAPAGAQRASGAESAPPPQAWRAAPGETIFGASGG